MTKRLKEMLCSVDGLIEVIHVVAIFRGLSGPIALRLKAQKLTSNLTFQKWHFQPLKRHPCLREIKPKTGFSSEISFNNDSYVRNFPTHGSRGPNRFHRNRYWVQHLLVVRPTRESCFIG
jgi:hypothetical protein